MYKKEKYMIKRIVKMIMYIENDLNENDQIKNVVSLL